MVLALMFLVVFMALLGEAALSIFFLIVSLLIFVRQRRLKREHFYEAATEHFKAANR